MPCPKVSRLGLHRSYCWKFIDDTIKMRSGILNPCRPCLTVSFQWLMPDRRIALVRMRQQWPPGGAYSVCHCFALRRIPTHSPGICSLHSAHIRHSYLPIDTDSRVRWTSAQRVARNFIFLFCFFFRSLTHSLTSQLPTYFVAFGELRKSFPTFLRFRAAPYEWERVVKAPQLWFFTYDRVVLWSKTVCRRAGCKSGSMASSKSHARVCLWRNAIVRRGQKCCQSSLDSLNVSISNAQLIYRLPQSNCHLQSLYHSYGWLSFVILGAEIFEQTKAPIQSKWIDWAPWAMMLMTSKRISLGMRPIRQTPRPPTEHRPIQPAFSVQLSVCFSL